MTRNLCDFPYTNLTHIPRFKRVRKVSLFNGKLTCNCTLRTTFGLLCPHVLCVKRIADESYIPTYRDISCVWWKSYYKYSYESNTGPGGGFLPKIFQLLRQKETVGILTSQHEFENIPVHTGWIPSLFCYDMNAPKCVNYPDHMCIMDNVTPGVPGNMSQVHNVRDRDDDTFGAQNDGMDSIHNDDTNVDEDLVSDSNNVFNEFFERDSNVCNEQGNPFRNPYAYLKMSFSEMTEVMTGNVTIEELNDIKSYLNSVTDAIMSRENQKKRNVWNPDQRFVSSNAQFKKKFKTHSTGFV